MRINRGDVENSVSNKLSKTEKTSISRHPERASYDRETANAILDEGLVAHVGLDTGSGVMVVPMTYARMGDELMLHGAVASRWLSGFKEGRSVSICVTLLDGLVLAQSAFSHSMNYRSVVVFGNATLVSEPDLKMSAFKALLEHMLPGRWDDSRQPDEKEIAATTVIRVPINEASVKIRSGPPVDSAKDLELDYWTGVIPLKVVSGDLIPDSNMPVERSAPLYAADYKRGT